jgi:hypothetical protein
MYLLEVIRNECLGRVSAIAAAVLRDTCRGFRVVQLHTSRKSALCKQAKLRDDELVELDGGLAWGSLGCRRGRTRLLGTQLHRVNGQQQPSKHVLICLMRFPSAGVSQIPRLPPHAPDFAYLDRLRGTRHDNAPR